MRLRSAAIATRPCGFSPTFVGRATRVWEAKKMEWDDIEKWYFVPDGRASVVVKDFWVNKQEPQEAMTIKRIR
jgi:hypothetical protein